MDFSIDSVIPCWYTRCASEVGRRLCTSLLQEEVMKSVWMVAGRMLSTLQWITPEMGVWGDRDDILPTANTVPGTCPA